MARLVFGADVGFGFDDPANRCAIRMLSHQVLAKQLPGDIKGRLLVEGTLDFHGLRECFLEPLRQLLGKLVGLARIIFCSFPLEYVERQLVERR